MATKPDADARLTYKELSEMFPEQDKLRRELIDGELIVTPSPSVRHQFVVGELFAALRAFARRHGGRAYPAPLDVHLTEFDVIEPDVVYVGPEKLDLSEQRYLKAVDIVVEVSSPSSRRLELVRKLRLYEQHRVPEYWYVDLEADRFEIYRHTGDGYSAPVIIGRSETIESPLLVGFSLSVNEVLGPAD